MERLRQACRCTESVVGPVYIGQTVGHECGREDVKPAELQVRVLREIS